MLTDDKYCPACELTLNRHTDFYQCSLGGGRVRPSSYCKACTRARSRREYRPEYRREYERAHRERRKQLETKYYRNNQRGAVAAYGGKCECCGETEPLFLEIDHIHGGGTQERKKNSDIEGFYRMLIAEKPEGFRVLCSNCNRGRWRNKGLCPHQTNVAVEGAA